MKMAVWETWRNEMQWPREALHTYAADKSEGRLPSADVIRAVLCVVPGQVNDLSNVSGSAPSRWVRSKATAIPANLIGKCIQRCR